MNSYQVDKCLLCSGQISAPIVDLGESPLANDFDINPEVNKQKYPLRLVKCLECNHVQLDYILNPEILFKNYLFVSGTSLVTQKYFEKYANDLINKFSIPKSTLILDIASSDGTLLKYFQKLGMMVLGVEPAENLSTKCNNEGINTIPKFFDNDVALEIINKYGKLKLITSNNVLAHNPNLNSFLQGIKICLDDDGIWVVEISPLWELPNKWDEIYHEHMHYWHIESFKKYINKFDLQIFDAEIVNNMGGSVRFYVSHINKKEEISNSLMELSKHSHNIDNIIIQINKSFQNKKKYLNTNLNKYKDKKIAIFGCSAKLTTLIYSCLDNVNQFDFAIDNNTLKQNKYISGTNIKIHSPEIIYIKNPDVILIGAPNFSESIIKNNGNYKGIWV